MVDQKKHQTKLSCGVCEKRYAAIDVVPVDSVRSEIAKLLDRENPDWRKSGFICKTDLAEARRDYIEELIRNERGELSELDREVIDALINHEVISDDAEDEYARKTTFGEWLADKVATFGGSWTFIIAFACVLALWMAFNVSTYFSAERFDPYPFILLNLVLSCLAAVQAPLIMMSQKRQESKDRQRAQNDYQINLKAELEIRQLHEKMDYMLMHQWQRMAEYQATVLEELEELRQKTPKP